MREAVTTLLERRKALRDQRRRLAAVAELQYKALRKLPVLRRKSVPPGYVCHRWVDGQPWGTAYRF